MSFNLLSPLESLLGWLFEFDHSPTAAPRRTLLHSHYFQRTARLKKTDLLGIPFDVDVFECACGARKVVPRGSSPSAAKEVAPDKRGFPHNCLIDASDLKEYIPHG